MSRDSERLSPTTRLMRSGQQDAGPQRSLGSAPALDPSSTWAFPGAADLSAAGTGEDEDVAFYARYGHPNARQLEEALAMLEGTEAAAVFSSGLAAIHTAWHALLDGGETLCIVAPAYGGTLALAADLERWGLRVQVVPIDDTERVRAAIASAKLVHLEALTNPMLRIPDFERITSLAREYGATTMIDATFVTPCFLRPVELGFDLVMHSLTKYLGGHGDVLGGVIAGCADLLARIGAKRKLLGNVLAADPSWRVLRSLKTVSLRMDRIEASTARLGEFLRGRPEVERVHDPRHPGHGDHERGRRWFTGFGGILTFEARGGDEAAARFVDGLNVFHRAASLGGFESLACQPRTTSHAHLDEQTRRRDGILPGCVRLSIGLEDPADLERDLGQALGAMAKE